MLWFAGARWQGACFGKRLYRPVAPALDGGNRSVRPHPDPIGAFAEPRGHVALHAAPPDLRSRDAEAVRAWPGGVHGGGITTDPDDPFKRVPGQMEW